jgi:ABC-type branched-subunit amino acid transport system permease subunit
MVVLGGMGSINGSLIAAALITFINTKLQTVLTGNLAVLQNVVYALILITIVIYKNAPGLKGFRAKYNLNTLMAKLSKKKKEEADHE